MSDLSPLKDLANLQRLDIDKTNVVDLKSLENLLNLEKIDLSGCQINDLSPLKALIEKGIALKWEDWKDEPGIYVKDCPLDKPLIAAIKKGNPAVLNYLNKPKERLFEARVLVLGEPRAGKTTLRRKLKSPSAAMPAQSESTKAFEIEIEPYKCDIEKDGERHKMIYNLWDFGGQDYYRLLHQLFVAEQSVYVIVTDTDRNKNEEEIDFWLQTIQRQGRDKQGNYGPVVLVQNPKTNREGSDFIDLKKRYPFWRQNESFLINLNALDEKADTFDRKELERFRRFKAHLEASFCQLNHVGREMPRQWVNVRRALAKLEKNNHISVEDFYTVCKKKGIVQITEQTDLLDIFHTLGYLLHYKDSDLQSMVILNREWVTDALYRVLDDAIVRENKGWFRKEDAQKIWYEPQYTNRTTELLALMQEFKLSYFNTASQKHIVPAKLPENTDGMPEWNTEHNVRLHLKYDWLPRVVPIQLIVSLHNYLVPLDKGEQWIWRNGCVLNGKALDITDAEVKIEDDWRNNRIEISARGEQSELLIRTLMKHWREVNQPFEDKVEVDKSILCHCEKCQTAARPFEFEYEDVLDARAANETLKCNKSRKDFQAAAILRGLFDEATASLDAFTRKGGRMDEAIKKLLEEGKLGEALDKLHNYDFATGLKARYSDSKRSYDLGLVSREDWNVEKARLVNTLLSYLSEYNEKQFLGGQYLKGKFREGFGAGKMDIPFAYDSVESPSQIHHHTYHNSQVYQSEHIGKIEHTHNIGISKEELDSLRQQIAAFTTTQQTELKAIVAEAAPTEAAKMSIGQKAMDWLNKNAEGIVGNVAASVYYDALKGLLGL
ncbi:MAG: COR domain-containing protein [Saprospiraceae bacterium]|nr:COR domain-containing protein [Saprospiraceae bacterium]